jgi:glycosyltransferase involved in cell wall biosynthesis
MISIITPVFNGVSHIRNCIESVASQQFEGLEHLIMDAASTDGTRELIERMLPQFPHLRLHSEPDKGQSDAMNKGIRMAKNPVISFLNADDRYESGAIKLAMEFFRNAPADSFFLGNCRVLHEDGSEYMINRPSPFDRVAFMLDFTFPFNPSAYFYHKSIHAKTGYYNEDDHLTMDIDFLMSLKGRASIHYRDVILGNYIMISNSKTMKEISAGRNLENLRRIFEKHWPDLSAEEKIRYHFQKSLGKNRGWIMHYLHNPKEIPALVLKKIGFKNG